MNQIPCWVSFVPFKSSMGQISHMIYNFSLMRKSCMSQMYTPFVRLI